MPQSAGNAEYFLRKNQITTNNQLNTHFQSLSDED